MIRGAVTAAHEAVVCLHVLDAGSEPHPIEVIVDTGYTGFLTLPPSRIADLRLEFNRVGRALLADGSEKAFDIYDAVVWGARELHVRVDAMDAEPLVGMSMMYGYKLTVEDIVGGAVVIERLASD